MNSLLTLCGVATVFSSIDIQRTGWLDRVVEHRKTHFLEDVESLPPINIRATVVKAPRGYVDKVKWDFESVMRLIALVRQSSEAKPVAQLFRRLFSKSGRRLIMSKVDSYHHFPSIQDVYYDESSDEYREEWVAPMQGPIDNDSIVIVSNPVEARLPSSYISVRMLKEILEERANQARMMPSTQGFTIYWKPMNATPPHTGGDNAGGNPTTPGAGEGGGGGNGTGGPGGDATAAPEGGEETPAPEEAPAEGRRHKQDPLDDYQEHPPPRVRSHISRVVPGSDNFYVRSAMGDPRMHKSLPTKSERPTTRITRRPHFKLRNAGPSTVKKLDERRARQRKNNLKKGKPVKGKGRKRATIVKKG